MFSCSHRLMASTRGIPCSTWPNLRQAKSVNLSESQYRLRIPQQRDREIARSLRNSCDDVVIIRLRGNRDDCVVPEAIRSALEFHANDAVPMAVVEFLGVQVIAE